MGAHLPAIACKAICCLLQIRNTPNLAAMVIMPVGVGLSKQGSSTSQGTIAVKLEVSDGHSFGE